MPTTQAPTSPMTTTHVPTTTTTSTTTTTTTKAPTTTTLAETTTTLVDTTTTLGETTTTLAATTTTAGSGPGCMPETLGVPYTVTWNGVDYIAVREWMGNFVYVSQGGLWIMAYNSLETPSWVTYGNEDPATKGYFNYDALIPISEMSYDCPTTVTGTTTTPHTTTTLDVTTTIVPTTTTLAETTTTAEHTTQTTTVPTTTTTGTTTSSTTTTGTTTSTTTGVPKTFNVVLTVSEYDCSDTLVRVYDQNYSLSVAWGGGATATFTTNWQYELTGGTNTSTGSLPIPCNYTTVYGMQKSWSWAYADVAQGETKYITATAHQRCWNPSVDVIFRYCNGSSITQTFSKGNGPLMASAGCVTFPLLGIDPAGWTLISGDSSIQNGLFTGYARYGSPNETIILEEKATQAFKLHLKIYNSSNVLVSDTYVDLAYDDIGNGYFYPGMRGPPCLMMTDYTIIATNGQQRLCVDWNYPGVILFWDLPFGLGSCDNPSGYLTLKQNWTGTTTSTTTDSTTSTTTTTGSTTSTSTTTDTTTTTCISGRRNLFYGWGCKVADNTLTCGGSTNGNQSDVAHGGTALIWRHE